MSAVAKIKFSNLCSGIMILIKQFALNPLCINVKMSCEHRHTLGEPNDFLLHYLFDFVFCRAVQRHSPFFLFVDVQFMCIHLFFRRIYRTNTHQINLTSEFFYVHFCRVESNVYSMLFTDIILYKQHSLHYQLKIFRRSFYNSIKKPKTTTKERKMKKKFNFKLQHESICFIFSYIQRAIKYRLLSVSHGIFTYDYVHTRFTIALAEH